MFSYRLFYLNRRDLEPDMTLADMKVPSQCRIISAANENIEVQGRLYALGLYPGVSVSILRLAPTGDPIQIRTGGMLLSIRKHEAAIIEVEAI